MAERSIRVCDLCGPEREVRATRKVQFDVCDGHGAQFALVVPTAGQRSIVVDVPVRASGAPRASENGPAPDRDTDPVTGSVEVSSVVRLTTPLYEHEAGTVAMVIGNARPGGDTYPVMVPGDPATYAVPASHLEVVRAAERDVWWRR